MSYISKILVVIGQGETVKWSIFTTWEVKRLCTRCFTNPSTDKVHIYTIECSHQVLYLISFGGHQSRSRVKGHTWPLGGDGDYILLCELALILCEDVSSDIFLFVKVEEEVYLCSRSSSLSLVQMKNLFLDSL